MTTEWWAIGLTLVAQVIGSFTPVFLKKASAAMTFSLQSLLNKSLWVAVASQFFSMILYAIALKGGELSFIYPLVSTVYIWASLLSIKLLGECMNAKKWAGIALIIVGVTFIGLGA